MLIQKNCPVLLDRKVKPGSHKLTVLINMLRALRVQTGLASCPCPLDDPTPTLPYCVGWRPRT